MNGREYDSLRAELVERINLINTQSSNTTTIILALWGAATAFLAIPFSNADMQLSYVLMFYALCVMCFVAAPCYLLPMAIKSGENFRQIASISAYIRTFYELPELYKEKKEETFFWESANYYSLGAGKEIGIDQMKFFNEEYTVLGIISFLGMSFSSVLFLLKLLSTNNNSLLVIILCIVVETLVLSFMIWLLVKIHKSSCTKKNFINNLPEISQRYLIQAKRFGILPSSLTETEIRNSITKGIRNKTRKSK